MQRKPKLRKCKMCPTMFEQRSMGHVVCSPACAVQWAAQKFERDMVKRKKAERARDRVRREKLKTRSDWMKEAQSAFNAYIRERDRQQPCICCGLPLGAGDVGGKYDCGHYRSVGSAPHLRFDERNAHAQRKQCNRYGAGRAVDYRLGLIRRLGLAAVEALESDQSVRKWTVEELRAIRDEYRAKLKALRAER